MSQRDRLLRRALYGNAIFTLACVSMMFGFGRPLARAMGLSDPVPLTVVAVGLIPFALGVVWTARRPQIHVPSALLTCLGDFAWVVGSAILLVGWSEAFSPIGIALVLAVAVVVAGFAVIQLLGVRALVQNDRSCPEATMALEFYRDIQADPKVAWIIVSDVDGYASYAPTLHFSRITRGAGVGAVRECGDAAGRWTETCTAWQEGRSYRFRVDTQAPDYPFPIVFLEGHWRVDPIDKGARITMRFELTPKGGVLGELATAAMWSQFERGAKALLDNWERAILRDRPEPDRGAAATVNSGQGPCAAETSP